MLPTLQRRLVRDHVQWEKNNNEIFKFKIKPKITIVGELRERDAGSGSSRAAQHTFACGTLLSDIFFRRNYIKHHRRLYGKIEWFFLILFYYLQLKFLLVLFPSFQAHSREEKKYYESSTGENRHRLECLEPCYFFIRSFNWTCFGWKSIFEAAQAFLLESSSQYRRVKVITNVIFHQFSLFSLSFSIIMIIFITIWLGLLIKS